MSQPFGPLFRKMNNSTFELSNIPRCAIIIVSRDSKKKNGKRQKREKTKQNTMI